MHGERPAAAGQYQFLVSVSFYQCQFIKHDDLHKKCMLLHGVLLTGQGCTQRPFSAHCVLSSQCNNKQNVAKQRHTEILYH